MTIQLPPWQHQLLFAFVILIAIGFTLVGCGQVEAQATVMSQELVVQGESVVVTRLMERGVALPVTATPPNPDSDPVVLDLAMSGEPAALDPQKASSQNEMDLIENLFVGLTRLDHATNRVEPDLATEWEVSADGLTWTFHLRSDLFWVYSNLQPSTSVLPQSFGPEPYRPVVADDVVYAIQRACDSRTQAPDVLVLFIIEGCQAVHGQAEVTDSDLQEIGAEAPDETTLVISLREPAGYFLTITTLQVLRPVPREIVAAYAESGEPWASLDNLISNGRFVLDADSVDEARTVLRRNPYWPTEIAGTVDRVNILWLETDEAYELWLDKALDVSPLPAGRRAEVMRDTRLAPRMHLVSGQSTFYLAFNFESSVFSDPAIRRAFDAAIDRRELIELVYDGNGLPMRHFTPPGTVGAPPVDQAGVGYSPDWARRQMRESSIQDCEFLPEIRYLVANTDLALFHAETVRSMWERELGCPEEKIAIEQVQFGSLLASTRGDAGAARPDIWDLGWVSYYPDAHNWLGDVLHCTQSENRQNRPCSQADELIEEAATTQDRDQRWSLYRRAEELFFGDSGLRPVAPLFVQGQFRLRQPWLTYNPANFGGEQYDTYQIDATTKRLEREQ